MNDLITNAYRVLNRCRDRATSDMLRRLIQRIEGMEQIILLSTIESVPAKHQKLFNLITGDITDLDLEEGPVARKAEYYYDEANDTVRKAKK